MVPAHNLRRPPGGLTLVEVTVALTLLVFGVLVVLGAQLGFARATRRSHDAARLAVRATSILDSLRMTGCASLVAGTDISPQATLAWRPVHAQETATVTMTVIPRSGASWGTETVLPCR